MAHPPPSNPENLATPIVASQFPAYDIALKEEAPLFSEAEVDTWQAAFQILTLAHTAPDQAKHLVFSILDAQWPNGMIPCRFVPSGGKAPETMPDWKTGFLSPGFTAPPFLATVVKTIYQHDRDETFLHQVLPSLFRFHQWLKDTRDPQDTGLVAIVHPWESGTPDSPIFDHLLCDLFPELGPPTHQQVGELAMQEIHQRFQETLLRGFQACQWDSKKMVETSPLLIAEPLFNSLWVQANRDLYLMARETGYRRDLLRFRRWMVEGKRAIRAQLWDKNSQFFCAVDLRAGTPIPVKTIHGFAPLFANVPTLQITRKLIHQMTSRRAFYNAVGLPSTAFEHHLVFDGSPGYRGAVWMPFHWLIIEGLTRYRYLDLAYELLEKSHRLVSTHGEWECYHPFTGEGQGNKTVPWEGLHHVMTYPHPPEKMTRPFLVAPLDELKAERELSVLYCHSDIYEKSLTVEEVSSIPPVLAQRIMRDVSDEINGMREEGLENNPALPEGFLKRVEMIGYQLKNLLQRYQERESDYSRLCDIASILVQKTFEALNYPCKIYWRKDLHFFCQINDPNDTPYVIDLTIEQFAFHSLSRSALLLEEATLGIRAELEKPSPSWLYLENMLEDTLKGIEYSLHRYPMKRLNAYERAALVYELNRHERHLLKLPKIPGKPLVRVQQEFFNYYLAWFRNFRLYTLRK